ncbi:MAG: SMP-30/gluconolactonase/LRE family protein [Albidovulum sp.]
MTARIFDARICALGEGPLWHPIRKQLFWFDILGNRLLSRAGDAPLEWRFDEHVSAAGWIDADRLLIASETGLMRLDLRSGESDRVIGLEEQNLQTRSNDGRADPWGGFWIGTMGKNAQAHAGAIYRFYQGTMHRLFGQITIPNAICFSPDRAFAYFTDTVTQVVLRQGLDKDGWPKGAATPFVDLTGQGLNPDGAVVDKEGCLWIAQWGASRLARYGANGSFLSSIDLPASQITCPAFGGDDLKTLYVTSAAIGVDETDAGKTFLGQTAVAGQQEYQVIT